MVKTVVQQVHACRNGVEGALGAEGGSRVGVEAAADAEANGGADGCDQNEGASQKRILEVVVAS